MQNMPKKLNLVSLILDNFLLKILLKIISFSVVRKAPRGQMEDDSGYDSSPCPSCDASISNMETTCSQCRTNIPICIATGQHVQKYEMTTCPECDFPAIKTEFVK